MCRFNSGVSVSRNAHELPHNADKTDSSSTDTHWCRSTSGIGALSEPLSWKSLLPPAVDVSSGQTSTSCARQTSIRSCSWRRMTNYTVRVFDPQSEFSPIAHAISRRVHGLPVRVATNCSDVMGCGKRWRPFPPQQQVAALTSSSISEFIDTHPEYLAPNNSMKFLSDNGGNTYNMCHCEWTKSCSAWAGVDHHGRLHMQFGVTSRSRTWNSGGARRTASSSTTSSRRAGSTTR